MRVGSNNKLTFVIFIHIYLLILYKIMIFISLFTLYIVLTVMVAACVPSVLSTLSFILSKVVTSSAEPAIALKFY